MLVHCAAGRDRTGLVTLLLLALAGVPPDEIAADYALSAERLRARWTHEGRPDEDLYTQEHLRQANTSARETIVSVLASLDVAAYLRAGGLRPDQEATILSRLLGDSDDRPGVIP